MDFMALYARSSAKDKSKKQGKVRAQKMEDVSYPAQQR